MKRIRFAAASAIVASAISITVADRPPQAREPASRAAVVLTWNQAQREAGFAGMERIAINSAAEHPTGRGQGQARQDFIAAVKAEIDREKK